ncbi:MAG: chemoreceptor glutamine deamidase CheD [Pseudomonadota bacterium]
MMPAPVPPLPESPRAMRVVPGRLDRLRRAPRAEGEAETFYHEPAFGADAVRVQPGEFYVHDEEMAIATTLGSCIAVCLWDREVRVGGLNHFMLPAREGDGRDSGRYGLCAMERLINAMLKRGARRGRMEAKVFGGASLMAGPGSGWLSGGPSIGARNTRFVIDYLHTERIALVSRDVLGHAPRKVCFFPYSGRAMVRRLPETVCESVLALDRDAMRHAMRTVGSVDLF